MVIFFIFLKTTAQVKIFLKIIFKKFDYQ